MSTKSVKSVKKRLNTSANGLDVTVNKKKKINIYNNLQDDDDGGSSEMSYAETETVGSPPAPKIPPIVLRSKVEDIPTFYDSLKKACTQEVHLRSNNATRQIFTYNLEDFTKVKDLLKATNMEFYSYTLKQAQRKKLILRGIDKSIQPKLILEDLQRQVKHVDDVKQFTTVSRDSATNDPLHSQPRDKLALFLVYFNNEANTREIKKNVSVVYHHKITWESYSKKKGSVTQCSNCQQFGHAGTNCNLPCRCIKCGKNHTSKNCPETPPIPAKCANCGDAHVASYRKCASYLAYKKRIEERKNRQINNTNINRPNPGQQQGSKPNPGHYNTNTDQRQDTTLDSTRYERTQSYSFVIPVNIRVTDVNDNAPQWVGAPYSLTLSEVTVPGTRILQGARAIDLDQQGPFSTVEYSILPGLHSDVVSFVSPLEGTLILRKPLDYEILKNFTVKLRAQDQGTPPKFSDTTLRVTITDADDQNPKFLKDSYRGELPFDGNIGELQIKPEPIKALDQDEGLRATLQYTIAPSPESRYFSINPRSGVVSLITALNPVDVIQTVTLVIKATQVDNPDRYALTTLIISRRDHKQNGTELAFLQARYHARAREDLGVGSRILVLTTNRPNQHLRFQILEKAQMTIFSITNNGEVLLQKSLDYENCTRHSFNVTVTDGVINATAQVTVEVINVNDWEPRFRESHYEFIVPKSMLTSEPVALGKLEAADGDRNDKIVLDLKGPLSELFNIDSKGVLWLRRKKPNVTMVNFIATATDNGHPPKSTSVPVSVRMEDLALAQSTWAPGVLGAFGVILSLFILATVGLSIYIYKSKNLKTANRIHSQSNSTTSAANLVSNEKQAGGGLQLAGGNMTLGNPIGSGHGGSGSSLSAGASTILAASLEREAQRDRERDNYTATVRSIISRASAARNGLYDGDIERDSISNPDIARTTWGESLSNTNLSRKKLSWTGNGDSNKTEIGSLDNIGGSTENNLTVYF
ncbi:protocadherin Fat 1 [Sergentomyia squamirostris]